MATRRLNQACEKTVTELEQPEPGTEAKTPRKQRTKPKHFRKTVQDAIGENYIDIVETLASKAVQGSVQHTKLLFDLGGVDDEVQAAATPRRRRPPSLGRILLAEVEAMKRNKEKEAQGGEIQ
jgi:hypothetical protein